MLKTLDVKVWVKNRVRTLKQPSITMNNSSLIVKDGVWTKVKKGVQKATKM